MTSPSRRCLLVYPRFTAQSFWNYRDACELMGAKYPTSPLGLITVASMLPPDWEVRLADLNVEELDPRDVEWADLILTGGQIFQQKEHLRLIEYFRSLGKRVVAGGPDPTSSPHLYGRAHHLVLGEAEVTLPEFLEDFAGGRARHRYDAGGRRACMAVSPTPRFDLLKLKKYLHVSLQWNRGCPFLCEFCDIIELFGRVPRGKSFTQFEAELQALYGTGFRGHVEIVDDNFIGNKKAVKELLPSIIEWQRARRFPFEFSTEASLNLSDDEDLMGLMEEAGFTLIFVGIETPDEETLRRTQKLQNTRRSIAESVHRINRHGMIVVAGYIMGFDGEKGSVSQAILDCIESSNIAVSMVGLLYALPNTQLTRRLIREGRLRPGFESGADHTGDQCVSGLNFHTLRSRLDILKDYRHVIQEAFSARNYFGRVLRVSLMLNTAKRRLRFSVGGLLKDLRAFSKLSFRMALDQGTRFRYWKVLAVTALRNPKAVREAISLMALYLHFQKFRDTLLERLKGEMENLPVEGKIPLLSR